MEVDHGCRSEYGPLELRIQSSARLNGFTVFVEDSRLDHTAVYEHPELGTLDSAKERAILRAEEYLNARSEEASHAAKWRCS